MRGWSIVAVVLVACGPQVSVPDADGSTGTDASSTSGASVSTTRGDGTGTPMTTAAPPSPSTTMSEDGPIPGTTMGDDATDGGEVDSGEDMCDCQGRAVDLRTPLDEGYTPADMLQFLASTSYPWMWSAIDGQPQTTVQIDVLYEGGAVIDEVGGCCGNFLCVPCPYGVTIEAFFRITSADGLLDEYVPATITGTLAPKDFGSEGIHNVSAQIPLPSLQGSLPAQMFANRDGPVIVDTIVVTQAWEWDGSELVDPHAHILGSPPGVFLGESVGP